MKSFIQILCWLCVCFVPSIASADTIDFFVETLENHTKLDISEDYTNNNKKWLLGIKANVAPFVEASVFIDMADYKGITNEGSANQGDGKEWVTIWVDASVGLGATGLISMFPLDFEKNEPDPRRNDWILAAFELEGGALISGMRFESFRVFGGGDISNARVTNGIGFEANLLDFGTNVLRFEMTKSALRTLMKAVRKNSGLDPTSIPNNFISELLVFDNFRLSINPLYSSDIRGFTSADNEGNLNNEYFSGEITRAAGVKQSNTFPASKTSFGIPIDNLNDLEIYFENKGKSTENFFIKITSLPLEWKAIAYDHDSSDGYLPWGDKKFDIADITVGETAYVKFAVAGIEDGAISPAESGYINIELWRDGLSAFNNTLLDKMKVPVWLAKYPEGQLRLKGWMANMPKLSDLQENSVDIIWDNNSTDNSTYYLQREIVGAGNWQTIFQASQTAPQIEYVDELISKGNKYSYRTYFCNENSECSTYSPEFTLDMVEYLVDSVPTGKSYDFSEVTVSSDSTTIGRLSGQVTVADGSPIAGIVSFNLAGEVISATVAASDLGYSFSKFFYLPETEQTVDLTFTSIDGQQAHSSVVIPAKTIVDDGSEPDPVDDPAQPGTTLIFTNVIVTSSDLLAGGGSSSTVQIKGHVRDDSGNNPNGSVSFSIAGVNYTDDLYAGSCVGSGSIDYCNGSFFVVNNIPKPYFSEQFKIDVQSSGGDLTGQKTLLINGTSGTQVGNGQISINNPNSNTKWRVGTIHSIDYFASGISPDEKLRVRLHNSNGQYNSGIGTERSDDTAQVWNIPDNLLPGVYKIRIYQDTDQSIEGWSSTFQIVDTNTAPTAKSLAIVAIAGETNVGQIVAWDDNEDQLTYSTPEQSDNGNAITMTDSSFTYVASSEFIGVDSFIVNVSDGVDSVDVTVSVTVILPENLTDFKLKDSISVGTRSESISFVRTDGEFIYAMSDDSYLRKYLPSGELVDEVLFDDDANGMDVGGGYIAVVDNGWKPTLRVYNSDSLALLWELEDIAVDNATDLTIGEGKAFISFQEDEPDRIKYFTLSDKNSYGGYSSEGVGYYAHDDKDITAVDFYRMEEGSRDLVLFSGGENEKVYRWREEGYGSSTGWEVGRERWSDLTDIEDIFVLGTDIYVTDDRGSVIKFGKSGVNNFSDALGYGWESQNLHGTSSIPSLYVQGSELYTGGYDSKINVLSANDGALRQSIDVESKVESICYLNGVIYAGLLNGKLLMFERNFIPIASPVDILTWSNLQQSVFVDVMDLDNSDVHGFDITTEPENGNATIDLEGMVTYIPAEDFYGTDLFNVTITDGEDSTIIAINVTVQNRPAQAVISRDTVGTVGTVGQLITLNGSAEDPEGDDITGYLWSIIEAPESSSIELTTTSAINTSFTPDVIGIYSISLQVSDGNTLSTITTLDISVINFAPAPTVSNFAFPVNNTTLAFVDVGDANTLDSHTFDVISEPQHGTVTVSPFGILSFTPENGYIGNDSFTVMVADSQGAESTVVVSFSVENTAPVAINSSLNVVNSQNLSGQLKGYDANGHSLLFSLVSQPANGVFKLDDAATGAFTFNASDEFIGKLTATFKVNDGYVDSAIGTLVIDVLSAAIDTDTDSIPDDIDNCPTVTNADQLNTDGADDGGDACDTDDDNDGIPDEYELTNGLNPLDASDATLDTDNDQLTNLQEFTLGTNPNDDDTDDDGIIDGLDSTPLDVLISSIQVNDTELARCITEKTEGLTTVAEVTTLDCSYFAIESLAGISQLTELETLSLYGTKLSSFSGVEGLSKLNNLRAGDISTLADISAIADMTQLTTLDIYNTGITDISALANLTNLAELDSTGTIITDYSVLFQLEQLTWLGLNNSVNDISPYAGLVKLNYLIITSALINYDQLVVFPQLSNLVLIDNSFSDLTKLSTIATQLSYLTINSSSLINMQNIYSFSNLSTLFLSGSLLIQNISGIEQLSLLKTLSLNDTKVSDISSLASLPELQKLYIDRTQVHDLSPLFSLGNLSRVSLRDIPLNDSSQIQVLNDKGVQVIGTPMLTNDIASLELSDLVEAIVSPSSGSVLYMGLNTSIVWDESTLLGNNIDIYVLHDDPTDIGGGTNVDLALVQARNWYKFADDVNINSSATLDPTVMNGSGNTYKLLVITDTGKWAVSEGLFSLIDQIGEADTDNDGISDAEDFFPELPSFKLTIISGSGQGLITSDVGNLNCGEVCELQLLAETDFTLNFIPNSGFVYQSLSSDNIGCSRGSSANYCNDVAGIGDYQVQVDFAVDTDNDGIADEVDNDDDNDGVIDSDDLYPITPSMYLTLKTAGVGSGMIAVTNTDISCTDECVVQLIAGSEFVITVAPDQGFSSVGWGNSQNLTCVNGTGPLHCNYISITGYATAQINFDLDTDLDGEGNSLDTDDDADSVLDTSDAFPLDATESLDTDLDGTGNNADDDDDNDGVLDVDDAFPLDATQSQNSTQLKVKNDVDGDGKSDLLWRSEPKGWNFLWAMDGVQTKQASPINVVQDEGWLMAGQGDYDADGKSDILWRNTFTGLNFIYLMDGLNIKTRQVLNYVDAPQWELRGSGDFNDDGKGDVLWRNLDRGDTWFYMMDGLNVGTSQPSLWVTDLNYKIAAIGDVNGDGTDDVIWRNQVTGVNYIWIMDNGQIANRYVLNAINGDWTIAGAGDLDGDGTDDFILRNQVDGRNWAYLMENGQIKTSEFMSTVGSLDWQIVDMGDYDGDGKADLLWRNETTTRNIVHLMDGLTVKDKGVLRPTDNTWQLAQ